MNTLFQRINLSFPNFSISSLKGNTIAYHINPITNQGFVAYDIASSDVLTQLTQLAPLENPKIAYSEIFGNLEPHRDFGGTCVLNYYIDTNLADTIFYSPKHQDNQFILNNGAEIYEHTNCTEVARFTAQDNSCWILNIGEIHSVIMPTIDFRRIISIGYPQYDFNTVREKLKAIWY